MSLGSEMASNQNKVPRNETYREREVSDGIRVVQRGTSLFMKITL